MQVRHAKFTDGTLGADASRAGCVTYGQTRNFSLTSIGVTDGNLYAAVVQGNVSRLRVSDARGARTIEPQMIESGDDCACAANLTLTPTPPLCSGAVRRL